MKVFALLALLVALTSAHMCLFTPQMRIVPVGDGTSRRPDINEGPLTADEFNNVNGANVAFDKCRRNINSSPFGNSGTAAGFGSVCGGSATHIDNINDAWNTPQTPTVYGSGDTITIQWLENAAHPDPEGGRSSFHRIDYSPLAIPQSNSDFVEIGVVASLGVSNQQYSFQWTIPEDLQLDNGVLRVVYFSGLQNTSADPTLAGVSNTYASCADIQINSAASLVMSFASLFALLLVFF
eukprot:TRINITY_DN3729_c0_g1_i2.p1 TRINITY_DN3729_c0_g1~~TRINITY_DN3729_c0_g1_i2.p1  ORF type:complete len:238 (-),score=41.53 TRINITY_DN3729_c0_g1_i2:79-792(-)